MFAKSCCIFVLIAITISVVLPAALKSEPSYKNLLNNTDWIKNWKAPAHVIKGFPYYLSGYDDQNRAIIVAEVGKWDPFPYIENGSLELAQKYIDQFVARVRTGFFERKLNASEESSNSDEVIPIMDFDGFLLRQLTNPECLKFFVDKFNDLGQMSYKFPYGFIINVTSLSQLALDILKSNLGNAFERLDIYGTLSAKWIPQLLRKLPADQLKPKYGGPKDFKPVMTFG